MLLRTLGLLASFAVLSACLPAADQGLKLNWVLDQVRQHNPEIRTANAEAGMAEAQAGASWALPDPQIGVEFWDVPRPGFDLGAAGQKMLDFSQDIPFPTKLYYQAQVARHEVARLRSHAAGIAEDQVLEAKKAYWDYFEAQASLGAIGQAQAALDRLFGSASERAGFGRGGREGQLMAAMAAVEKAGLENQALDLEQKKTEAGARLKSLMASTDTHDLDDPADLPVEAPVWVDEGSLIRGAVEGRQDLAEARHHVVHSEAQEELAKSGWLPDLMLQYNLVEMQGGMQASMFMAKINLPFVYFWRQSAEVRAAARQVEHSRAMLDGEESATRQGAVAAWQAYARTLAQLKHYDEEILPQARASLRLGSGGVESGSLGESAGLEAVRTYWMAQTQRIGLQAALGRAVAVMERLVGGNFDNILLGDGSHEHHHH